MLENLSKMGKLSGGRSASAINYYCNNRSRKWGDVDVRKRSVKKPVNGYQLLYVLFQQGFGLRGRNKIESGIFFIIIRKEIRTRFQQEVDHFQIIFFYSPH